MLDGMDAHFIQHVNRLLTEHLDNLHMLLGVEIPHEHALPEHLIQQGILRATRNTILAHGRPLVRQPDECGVGRGKELERLHLGRQAREEGQGREDGVFKDLCQACVMQGLVWKLVEEVDQDAQPKPADRGHGFIDEGEQDRDEERPVFGDELGLGLVGWSQFFLFFVELHMRYP
jgi:hypothetical protein